MKDFWRRMLYVWRGDFLDISKPDKDREIRIIIRILSRYDVPQRHEMLSRAVRAAIPGKRIYVTRRKSEKAIPVTHHRTTKRGMM